MPFRWDVREHAQLGRFLLRWLAIGIPVGGAVGSAVALFLWSLDKATALRWRTMTSSGLPWLVYLLPAAGVAIVGLYIYLCKSVEGGK